MEYDVGAQPRMASVENWHTPIVIESYYVNAFKDDPEYLEGDDSGTKWN
jgi:hypothetical protein